MTDLNRGWRHLQPNKRTSADEDKLPNTHDPDVKSERDVPDFDMTGIHPELTLGIGAAR